MWDIADTLNGLMALPNLLSVLMSIPLLREVDAGVLRITCGCSPLTGYRHCEAVISVMVACNRLGSRAVSPDAFRAILVPCLLNRVAGALVRSGDDRLRIRRTRDDLPV